MNTTDVNAWKDLLAELQEISEQNQVIIEEIKEEVARQKQRHKKEIQTLSETVSKQAADLEGLLGALDTEDLFGLPGDQGTLNSFKSTLQNQLERTRQLVNYSRTMLEAPTTSYDTMEKLKVKSRRSSRERTRNYLPKLFRQEHILGNWIHYYEADRFTCQAFWDDNSFKTYEFDKGKLVEEKEGIYEIGNGQVHMIYEDGSMADYTVTGFSDKTIDYAIEDVPVQFDYMPENLLNDFIDAQSMENE